jgi:hypothetical protein
MNFSSRVVYLFLYSQSLPMQRVHEALAITTLIPAIIRGRLGAKEIR